MTPRKVKLPRSFVLANEKRKPECRITDKEIEDLRTVLPQFLDRESVPMPELLSKLPKDFPTEKITKCSGIADITGYHPDLHKPDGPDNPAVTWVRFGGDAVAIASKKKLPDVLDSNSYRWLRYKDGKFERKTFKNVPGIGEVVVELFYGTERGGEIKIWHEAHEEDIDSAKKLPHIFSLSSDEKFSLLDTVNFMDWKNAKGEFDEIESSSDATDLAYRNM